MIIRSGPTNQKFFMVFNYKVLLKHSFFYTYRHFLTVTIFKITIIRCHSTVAILITAAI